MKEELEDKDKFNFWLPANIEKGTDKKGKKVMKIKGIASTPEEDSEGETLYPIGFDLQRFLSIGFLNWNHQAKNDAGKIIGEPTIAKITPKGDLYVEGVLYNDHPLAESVWSLGETLESNGSNRRLGFSIEGRALERDSINPKKITKALLTGLAVTPTPVNASTYVDLVKGEQKEDWIDSQVEDLLMKAENGNYLYEFEVSGVTYGITKSFGVEKIEKGGEGSKGGKVIGHTKSGKPIYDSFSHPAHKDFKARDHHEAGGFHHKEKLKYAMESERGQYHQTMAYEHWKKMRENTKISDQGKFTYLDENTEKAMDTTNTQDLIPESVSGKKVILEPEIKKAVASGLISLSDLIQKSHSAAVIGETRNWGGVNYKKVAAGKWEEVREMGHGSSVSIGAGNKPTATTRAKEESAKSDRQDWTKQASKERRKAKVQEMKNWDTYNKQYDALEDDMREIRSDYNDLRRTAKDLEIDMEEEVAAAAENDRDTVGNKYGAMMEENDRKMEEIMSKLKSKREEMNNLYDKIFTKK